MAFLFRARSNFLNNGRVSRGSRKELGLCHNTYRIEGAGINLNLTQIIHHGHGVHKIWITNAQRLLSDESTCKSEDNECIAKGANTPKV
jgi:hypothetical protein